MTIPNQHRHDKENFSGKRSFHSVVYGLRNWRYTPDGDLTGVIYYQYVWGAGDNVATCMSILKNQVQIPTTDGASLYMMGVPVPAQGFEINHPMDDCHHGFYAYYDGSRDYHDEGPVTGIIRGWEQGEIRNKGFRVLKARIVAILFDTRVPFETQARICEKYPDAEVFEDLESMIAKWPTSALDKEIDDPFEEES